MMVWTSKILIGIMAGDWRGFGSEVGQNADASHDFSQHPSHKSYPEHTKGAR
jgi:hypothetical protein